MWYVRPAKAQSDQSLSTSIEYSMTFKLLAKQHLEFLSLKGGFTGSYEFTLVNLNATLLGITCRGSFIGRGLPNAVFSITKVKYI